MAVIALILAILLPSLSAARSQARDAVCLSNQHQIALAMAAYAVSDRDSFPIAQYLDLDRGAAVAWDTTTYWGREGPAGPGLIWEYAAGGSVQQCPAFEGESSTPSDPYSGYNYNTTYVGRGEGEGPYLGMTEAPARTSEIRRPGEMALVGDGGWSAGANKFMRAPLDDGVAKATVYSGGQAFRHRGATLLTHADGHGGREKRAVHPAGASPDLLLIMGWPANGFLSADDRRYSRW